MEFWMIELLLCLLMPLAMLVNGILHLKKPSQSVSWTYGYRTRRSMKTQETWEFAQKHCGKMCCRWGSGLVVAILIVMMSVLGRSKEVIRATGAVIGIAEGIILACALLPTENALKKRFGV